ncbi:MAG: hypothetical protein M3P40_11055 [Actinomycetota bacterium]|nr:hypothetical protein [Actinomycetota bacterium]
MIDTMVFDGLALDADALEAITRAIQQKRLVLLTTPVQEHQIAEIRDVSKRKLLQRLPREVVPAAVALAGVSRTGRAHVSGHAPEGSAPWDRKHAADELIADAALSRADVLVTEDKQFTANARERGLETWPTAGLVAWAMRL